MAEVRLQELTFRYPDATADTLAGVSLEVARGEAHALLGSSGAGKTTLLHLLAGLLTTRPGQIFFDGEDVGRLPPYARRVTQVFQFPVLYEAMTVAENLAFPMRDLPAGERRVRTLSMAERLGIESLLHRRPAKLSLMEKQLVAIGKALTRPDVSLVLLDEPLTAASPEHKWQLRQTLRAVQQDLGATMIYVTHDQTEALTFADRVSVLHEGRILQTAAPRELVEAPAHEHVGYFVGSPGMNLVDGEIRGGQAWLGGRAIGPLPVPDGACRFGFRPEWAVVTPPDKAGDERGVPVEITATRTLGMERGLPVGLVRARIGEAGIVSRQVLTGLQPGPGRLHIDPEALICFRDGWRVTAHAG